MSEMFERWRKITNRLEELGQSYGLWPSPPDKRDFAFAVFAGTQPLPPSFSRRDEMPGVRNQGKLGTCVGHAAWAIKEWQERQQGDVPGGGLSPRYIYQMAKQLDGIPSTPGTYPRVAMKVLQDYGVCPETVLPYGELTTDVNLPRPPDSVTKAAEPYRISVYAQVKGLDELKRAIVEQGPVLLAVAVTESFVNIVDVIPRPGGKLLGGHAVCAVGYDDASGAVLIMNSWGTSWGQGGFAWLPYAAWTDWWIDRDIGWPFVMEAWACVDVPYTPKMARHIVLKIDNPTAIVDGEYAQLDVPPKVVDGRTLLPIRFVAERMGYVVNWQAGNRLVELRRPW